MARQDPIKVFILDIFIFLGSSVVLLIITLSRSPGSTNKIAYLFTYYLLLFLILGVFIDALFHSLERIIRYNSSEIKIISTETFSDVLV